MAELLVASSSGQASLMGTQGSSQPSVTQLLRVSDAPQIQIPLYEDSKQHYEQKQSCSMVPNLLSQAGEEVGISNTTTYSTQEAEM